MWVTVRLLLILECLLGLVSKQGDVTCAFLHAHLEEGEEVYLQTPRGFKQYDKKGNAKVLKLKRTLYMVKKLSTCSMKQSDLDPCLFISDTALLARKKREYKCRLVRKKLKEANSTIYSQSWEVPSAEVLLKSDLA